MLALHFAGLAGLMAAFLPVGVRSLATGVRSSLIVLALGESMPCAADEDGLMARGDSEMDAGGPSVVGEGASAEGPRLVGEGACACLSTLGDVDG